MKLSPFLGSGTMIFRSAVPELVRVPIFSPIRALFNFDGVGCGSAGFRGCHLPMFSFNEFASFFLFPTTIVNKHLRVYIYYELRVEYIYCEQRSACDRTK